MIINTPAPISLEDIKEYFNAKETTQYTIDYSSSSIQGAKLLVYLSNLDLPCDIKFENTEDFDIMVRHYIEFPQVVSIKSLEIGVLELISKESLEVKEWVEILQSLSLYSIYTINNKELREWVETFPEKTVEGDKGINFIQLLKYPEIFDLISRAELTKVSFYPKYFKEYIFKRKALYDYWASEVNPLFLLTWGVSSGIR